LKELTLEAKRTGEVIATYKQFETLTLEKGETLDGVIIKLCDGHEVSLLDLLKELGEI
jgi:hypothetical protein